MALVVSLDALAVYKPYLVKIEDIIYRCLYVDECLSSFQSTRNIFTSCWQYGWFPDDLSHYENSKIIIFANFLGTTMVGSTEYLNFTAFLRMLFSSRMKLGSGSVLISFTSFLQNPLCSCSFLSRWRFNLSMLCSLEL